MSKNVLRQNNELHYKYLVTYTVLCNAHAVNVGKSQYKKHLHNHTPMNTHY